jgi:hypothetical protein
MIVFVCYCFAYAQYHIITSEEVLVSSSLLLLNPRLCYDHFLKYKPKKLNITSFIFRFALMLYQ